MAELPTNFDRILHDGLAALQWAERLLEERLSSMGDRDDLLLQLRDVSGLAGRLRDSSPEEWEQKWMLSVLSPRDLGVLDEWEAQSARLTGAAGRSRQFRRLRAALAEYMA